MQIFCLAIAIIDRYKYDVLLANSWLKHNLGNGILVDNETFDG